MRLKTNDSFLICSFSSKRYAKDRHEMEKQIEKAKLILSGKKEAKRNKFLVKEGTIKLSLNNNLIEKANLLLGVKGYYTDLSLPNKIIIDRYSDLWQIEKDFRISKNDLLIRPIYHFKKEAIVGHILVCVAALAALKFMEIKTGKSAKYVIEHLKSVTDGRLLNTVTGKETLMRSRITEEVKELLKQMCLPY